MKIIDIFISVIKLLKIIKGNSVIIGGKYNKKDSSFIRKIYKLIKKILTYLKINF